MPEKLSPEAFWDLPSTQKALEGNGIDQDRRWFLFARLYAEEVTKSLTQENESLKTDLKKARQKVVLCGNCGNRYIGPDDEEKHGIGRCGATAW